MLHHLHPWRLTMDNHRSKALRSHPVKKRVRFCVAPPAPHLAAFGCWNLFSFVITHWHLMEIVICGTKRGQYYSALWCVSGFWVFPPCLHPGPSRTLPTAAWGEEERSLGEGDGKEVRLLIWEGFTERKVTQPRSSSLLNPSHFPVWHPITECLPCAWHAHVFKK